MTPEQIAARLSPAQIGHAAWRLPKHLHRAFVAVGDDPTSVGFDDRLALRRETHMVEAPFGWAVSDKPWRYSPLGQAVRAVLEKEQQG